MNKNQYRIARRMFRDNGHYALQWMRKDIGEEMARIIAIRKDDLADREEVFRDMGWGIQLSKSIALDIAARRANPMVDGMEQMPALVANTLGGARVLALAA
ncbi:hypothetical protein [Paraburkholderia fungorum]|uniref:Uncharacterized protein n=1 Tax=Paraburkholderia fungorum TaxID=134537 RepID=A0AAW3V3F2_9BURK|nr:hypothetical protein [Paraburkholderia fungorum]MBB4517247.1 hypothetical protein [Paraburkholderia fungorum]MBB6204315.1 hypothetical protein [Paraburkholderia fungorum]